MAAAFIALPISAFSRGTCRSLSGTVCSTSCHLAIADRPRAVRLRGRLAPFSPPRAVQSRLEEGEEGGLRAEEQDEGSPFLVLASVRSPYNEILVVDTPTSRVLLLDSTHNVHSILKKGQILTNSYWDEFATLPAIIPNGPIAILGLGGGTAAHVILDMWPSLHLIGWEIDGILVDKAREYFGLSDLEKRNHAGGFLSINVGDALSSSVSIPGGFAGIVVDLFNDGKVLPELQEVYTWLELQKKLMPHGRIMINCGGTHLETSNRNGKADLGIPKDDTWVPNSTIKAMCAAFDDKLSWKRMAEQDSENYMALTGPIPDLEAWSSSLPSELAAKAKCWLPYVDLPEMNSHL